MSGVRSMRLAAGLALFAVAVAAPSAAAAQPAGPLAPADLVRYDGADRYETSLLVAESVAANSGGRLSSVVMVSGEHWADAVVAASLAGAAGAPILMTPPDRLRADALDFLERVEAEQVTLVTSGIGAGSAVSTRVSAALTDAGIAVRRVGGSDRYATGVAVARTLSPAGSLSDAGRSAIIASGEAFADALVAGPLSARAQVPVLLTPRDELPSSAAAYLRSSATRHVLVMGGTAAVSTEVEDALRGLGISVDRMAGASRFETATMAAAWAAESFDDDCFSGRRLGLARARVPFDSFSAAPLLAGHCAPLVLSSPAAIPQSTAAYLDGVRAATRSRGARVSVAVFGGEAAVRQAALDAYLPPASSPGAARADLDCGGFNASPPEALFAHLRLAAEPVWSADCGRIAFVSPGHLWLADQDGENVTRLPLPAGIQPEQPAWSPDGTKIVFSALQTVPTDAGDEQRRHIWVVKPDGTGLAQLTSGSFEDERPAWSPDGTRIAFQRLVHEHPATRSGYTTRYIVVMEADGTNPVRPFKALSDMSWANGRPWSWEASPAWSPGGSRLALRFGHRLAVGAVDATEPADFTQWRSIGVSPRSSISWSPDGTHVAVSRRHIDSSGSFSPDSNIAIVDVGSGAVTDITSRRGLHVNPHWSPDGRRILFNSLWAGQVDGYYRIVASWVYAVGAEHRS